jgi:transglutaminase-like putative cysteine protease
MKTDGEKAAAIYNYIVKNYKYDYSKANKIDSSYIPGLEAFYNNGEGVCYDFAASYAAMLRSVDIPAKLLTGYKNDVNFYHSWNQVYLKESSKWVTIDTTYDSILLDKDLKALMIKDDSDYKTDRVF